MAFPIEIFTEWAGAQTVLWGLPRVCREWRAVVGSRVTQASWFELCVAEGAGEVVRHDGQPIDWRTHYLSLMKNDVMQKKAIRALLEGKNVCISGAGGTGKSVFIRSIATELRALGRTVAVTATTGQAATLLRLGGKTVHSFIGCGLATDTVPNLVKMVRRNRLSVRRWLETDVLIIDEISMLDPDLFQKIDQIGRIVRRNEGVFAGGLQIVCSGDFFQLPPVKPRSTFDFVFETPEWSEGIHKFFEFTHIFRAKDQLFSELLLRVRTGSQTEEDIAILRTRMHQAVKCPEGIEPTQLFSHVRDVEAYNQTKLEALPGEPVLLQAQITAHYKTTENHHKSKRKYTFGTTRAQEQAERQVPVISQMQLKKDAQVMLVVNLAPEEDLVNGSRGVVTGFEGKSAVMVKFMNEKVRRIEPYKWVFDELRGDRGEVIKIDYKQFPLTLASSLTVHKSQGATLDAAILEIGAKVFAPGQAYVALSRARSLDSIQIQALNPDVIRADIRVKRFYQHMARTKTHRFYKRQGNTIVFPTKEEMLTLASTLASRKRPADDQQDKKEEPEKKKPKTKLSSFAN